MAVSMGWIGGTSWRLNLIPVVTSLRFWRFCGPKRERDGRGAPMKEGEEIRIFAMDDKVFTESERSQPQCFMKQRQVEEMRRGLQ